MTGGASSNVSAATKERHLKKIYDCLNIGSNKKAVQEIDRLPKNIKSLTLFKSLKALALIRMYKRRQAFDILNEININNDLDEVTLQTMTSCYKESVDVSKIVDLYEAASKRHPNDAEILAHLFMAYVRVFNFKRQKEIALQMYKNFPKKKRLYSFWAIMSLVMQSQETKKSCSQLDSPDRKVCLSLAEKMCEKMIDEERNNEEIELYLSILRKQQKHEEEYKFLTGPICLRLTDHLSWFNRRRAFLCLDLKMYSRAFKHYFPTLIQEYPDQIEYYQGLFKSALLLDTEAQSQQQPVAVANEQNQNAGNQQTGTPVKSTSALAECYDIVEKQCILTIETGDSTKDKGKNVQCVSKNLSRTSSLNPNRRGILRGPFIARIELLNTILTNENLLSKSVYNLCMAQFANKYPTLNSLLLDYFQTFSRKTICYYDMDYIISLLKLSDKDKESLVINVRKWVWEIKQNSPETNEYDAFYIVMNYHMLKHSLYGYKVTDDKENRLNMAKEYINLYDQNRHLGKQASKTEFQPVDNYCLLAVNSIMTNALDLKDSKSQKILSDRVIVSLLTMVENAVSNSPSNHQLKLTLLKLYSLVGASKQCSEVLLSLDIKHFQIDTLGHLLNPVLYNTGNYSTSKESLETCLEFYAHGVRECFEGLTTNYRDGRFSKIEEISSVLKRLCDSLNATQCVLLKGIVANLGASTFEELDSAAQSFDPFKGLHRMFRCPDCADTMKDSRDFKVLKSLNAETNQLIQKRQSETMHDEQSWLKLRYYLIRSVYLQLELFNDNNLSVDDKKGHIAELALGREVVEKLRPSIDEAASYTLNDTRYSYFEPESSPFRWTHINLQSLVSLVCPIVFLTSTSDLNTEIQEDYNMNLDRIINDLEDQLAAINSLLSMKQALLSLTISIEFISLAITSLVSLAHLPQQATSASSAQNAVSQNSTGNTLGASKFSSSSQQQTIPVRLKPIPHQLINKTEAQLTKLSNLIKNVDPRILLDKLTDLEEILLSDSMEGRVETKCGSVLLPLMGQELSSGIILSLLLVLETNISHSKFNLKYYTNNMDMKNYNYYMTGNPEYIWKSQRETNCQFQ